MNIPGYDDWKLHGPDDGRGAAAEPCTKFITMTIIQSAILAANHRKGESDE